MNRHIDSELSPGLSGAVDALGAPPPATAEQRAQQRLMARLRGARRGTRAAPVRWVATAAASVLVAVAVVAMPLLSDQGRAFAQVLAHFQSFSTLSMQVEQRIDGRVLQASRMVVDADGVVRTDVGEQMSIVVDPVRGRILMLQHGPRAAVTFPFQPGEAPAEDALGWLEVLRDFQGKARKLTETRVIDGAVAEGWALDAEGMPMVLWVGADGLPLAMETGAAGELSVHYRFAFDVALPPGHLSSEVPAGYQRVEPDPH